jgi:hypothetical protein
MRILHGEEGKGRFRALALGRVTEWSVTSKNASGNLVRYQIAMIKDSARMFRVSDPIPVNGSSKAFVEVTIAEPYKEWQDFRTHLFTPGTFNLMRYTLVLAVM